MSEENTPALDWGSGERQYEFDVDRKKTAEAFAALAKVLIPEFLRHGHKPGEPVQVRMTVQWTERALNISNLYVEAGEYASKPSPGAKPIGRR